LSKVNFSSHPIIFSLKVIFLSIFAVPMEADVVKLVDTLVLGTSALSREGSSPFIRTNKEKLGCNATELSVGMQPPQGPPHMQRMGGNP